MPTTIAVSKKVYDMLLETKHTLEKKNHRSMSFSEVISFLVSQGGEES